LGIAEAHAKLRKVLLGKGCRIVAEEPPTSVTVKQGSLWGISPRGAKKLLRCRLSSVGSGTRIIISSKLASDWKNLTIIGSALAVIVASLCWWIALDLEGFVATQEASYWSWIATSDGYVSFEFAQALAMLARELAVFLAVVIVLEIAIVVFASKKIDGFAEDCLRSLG